MREIKFRAWDFRSKTMVSWSELFKSNLNNIFLDSKSCGMLLMQFTGLKDKNGKEIFEGDIVRSGEIVCEIIWDETWCAFRAKRGLSLTERINCYVWEIIGNIHETPELLNPNERRRV